MRYRTVFAVNFDVDGPHLDTLYNVDMDQMKADRAKYLLTRQTGEYSEDVQKAISGMSMRAQYTGFQLHNVHSDYPIGVAELTELLDSKQQDGTLKEFLNKARMNKWI